MRTKEHYPKRHDVPKDEVQRKRAARKLFRKKNRPLRVPKVRKDPRKNNWVETFRVPLVRKDMFEQSGEVFQVRDVRHTTGNTITVRMPKIKMDYLNWFWTNIVGKVISGDFGPKAKDLLDKFNVQMVILQEADMNIGAVIEKLQ